jgi:hypothetical protein
MPNPSRGLPTPLLGGGGGGTKKKRKLRRGEAEGGGGCGCVLGALCIFLLHQAWTGESDEWKCGHPIHADSITTSLGAANASASENHASTNLTELLPPPLLNETVTTGALGHCELRPGQPSGYEAACINAKTPATCADLVTTCVWNPAAAGGGFTDDGGAGHKLTHTVKWAMIFQTGLFWMPVFAMCCIAMAEANKDSDDTGMLACCGACTVCIVLVGFVYSWVMMISVVFGHTGDTCADAAGPDAGHITRLLWWSKALLWIQLCMIGCGCSGFTVLSACSDE